MFTGWTVLSVIKSAFSNSLLDQNNLKNQWIIENYIITF